MRQTCTERALAGLAARQHGVLTTGQLVDLGVTYSAIARRVQAGRLHRIHAGVYAVGHPKLSQAGR